jgi:hypothetical protein
MREASAQEASGRGLGSTMASTLGAGMASRTGMASSLMMNAASSMMVGGGVSIAASGGRPHKPNLLQRTATSTVGAATGLARTASRGLLPAGGCV